MRSDGGVLRVLTKDAASLGERSWQQTGVWAGSISCGARTGVHCARPNETEADSEMRSKFLAAERSEIEVQSSVLRLFNTT